jgi:tetratricopeptide (TPR) repeat protein
MSSKRRKPKAQKAQSAEPAAAASITAGASPARRSLSPGRLWLFRLLAVTLAPLAFLTLLECALWLSGYGYSTSFFVKIRDRDAYTTNQRFGWQFFPPAIAREPAVCELPAVKSEDAYRIFILGESAAMGTPEGAFAFGRMLEVMLRQHYAGVRFEVVNAAMTAINSNCLVPVAKECVRQKADLLILYMGNNEVIGPYGPGSVMGRYSPNRLMIRAGMLVKSWRTGQLLQNILRPSDARGKISAEWRGMEAFLGQNVTADDPRMEVVYEHFHENLQTICELARSSGSQVLLSTVATNLKDCAPLASVHAARLDASQRERCDRLCRAGRELAAQGKHEQAIVQFQQALAIDVRFADAHFCMARSLLQTGAVEKSFEHFVQARDLDALRFRADSRINQAIRDLAAQRTVNGVYFVDFGKLLEEKARTQSSLPGNEWFYEHVHLRPEGNYLLAEAIFRQLSPVLPEWVRKRAATGSSEPISFEACCQRLALTPWNRLQMEEDIATMTGRPPFTQQLDFDQQQAARSMEIRRLRAKYETPHALDEALHVYEVAIQANPDDLDLRRCLARLLLQRNDYQGAIQQWRYLLARFPDMAIWHANLGLALEAGGDVPGALAEFQQAGALNPSSRALVCYYSGNALMKQGKPLEAEQRYRQALELNPFLAKAQNALGAVLSQQGKTAEAEQAFQLALESDPSLASARANRAVLFEQQGKWPEALQEYQQALDITPTDLATYDHAVRVLRKMNDPQKAVAQYRRAVEAMPDNVEAWFGLGSLLEQYNQLAEATEAYRAAVRLDPDNLKAGHNLGAVLEKAGRTTEAIAQYRRVLQSHPDSAPTRANLNRLTGGRG